MRISDWSSDVCSSDLDFHGSVAGRIYGGRVPECRSRTWRLRSPSWEYCLGQDRPLIRIARIELGSGRLVGGQSRQQVRSEEHTSELQSLMRISYAVFCLKT